VQALREGWDCPFAYLLCSLQRLSSATAVEQLLGRVLRMPYASPRGLASLNRAYAHVCETDFSRAANALADRLISGMGFDPLDVASMLAPPAMPLFEAGAPPPPPVQTVVTLPSADGLQHAAGVAIAPAADGKGVLVTLNGHVDGAVETMLLKQVRGERAKGVLQQRVAQHNALVAAQAAPASRGVAFAAVPPLAYREDEQGELFPLEREAVQATTALDLLAQPAALPGFQVVESDNAFEIYVDAGKKVRVRAADASQLALDGMVSDLTADDLVRWLKREVRQVDVTEAHLGAYLHALVNHLVNAQGLSLNALARMRFVLARRIDEQIEDRRRSAATRQFRQLVLDGGWIVEPDWTHAFHFEPCNYPAPAATRYAGRWQFAKHYYPVIANLKGQGEEFECAKLIDRHPNVKHWVRNLEDDPGFWLPTSRGRFFPDFVAELLDGRIAVIEYKGEHLRNDPKEIEKDQVGRLWAKKSGGKCVFRFVYLNDGGVGMAGQVDSIVARLN